MDKNNELDVKQRINKFHQEKVEILKTKEGYGYKYAPLDIILPVIMPIMEKHGLGYFHHTEYNANVDKNILITTIFNIFNTEDYITSSTAIDNSVVLAKMNRFMVEGSALTYFRRYHLVTMLGLTTDEDSDAGGGRKATNSARGRGVENNVEEGPNFYEIFSKMIDKGKPKHTIEKMLEQYKTQISNDVLIKINKKLKDANK